MKDYDIYENNNDFSEEKKTVYKKGFKNFLVGFAFATYASLVPVMVLMQDKGFLLIGTVIIGEVAYISSRLSSTIKLISDADFEAQDSIDLDNSLEDRDNSLFVDKVNNYDNSIYNDEIIDNYSCFNYEKNRAKVKVRKR